MVARPVEPAPKGFTDNPVARRAMHDREGRSRKADKVLAVLGDHLGSLAGLRCLDISCSTGIMAQRFAGRFASVVAIDIDERAVQHARLHHAADNLEYHVMDALGSALASAAFDVVVCNQMYEHVADPRRLLDEVFRLLRPGGICYFGATNRLILIEPHYGRIPFLSLLPRTWADVVLRVLGRSDRYHERLRTVWQLRRLVRRFEVIDYTREVAGDPEKYCATDMLTPGSWGQRAALAVLEHAYWLFPGYIWLLRRP